ncbi:MULTISPECIES: ASCH domain-containing protein [unclassified Thermus]|uniref:ASCH domain-containing protein n=1 Tax=unclassified Thermus TaxID=2619321 RepID=UPI001EFAE716|nr:ASCH domain-containing protein [Thermus sp. NEB1569]ULR40317.1 ASCH domain-containing protein [Thermus sp. NEB1569]
MEKPKLGLIVREPYASFIVDGRKTWEIRKRQTRHRGPLGIITGGYLIGQADLLDVQGPFTVEELLAHPEKHLAEEAFLRAYAGEQPLYAWVLHNAFRYEKPLLIPKKPGRVMFVDLSEVWP